MYTCVISGMHDHKLYPKNYALQITCLYSTTNHTYALSLTSMHEDNKLTLACFSCGKCRSLRGRIPAVDKIVSIGVN